MALCTPHAQGGARPELPRTTHSQITSRNLWQFHCPRAHQHCRRVKTFATGFEPQAPGVAQLASSVVVIASTAISGLYWWFVVVPSERASLSKEKRRGSVKLYLEELEKDESRQAERWFYTEWREKAKKRKQLNAWGKAADTDTMTTTATSIGTASSPSAADTVSAATGEAARHKVLDVVGPAAEAGADGGAADRGQQEGPNPNLLKPTYETPTPDFLSLDNPIVFTIVLLVLLVGVAAVANGPTPYK